MKMVKIRPLTESKPYNGLRSSTISTID